MTSKVDVYFKNAKTWKKESAVLREILLDSGLEEELKWSKPCYVFSGKKVAIIQPFKACLGLMLFKGSLLQDAKEVLVDNGPNSQSARRFEFRSVEELVKMKVVIKSYLKEAIKLEKSGVQVEFKKKAETLPEELLEIFAKKPKFKKAFEALTPGRQRGYLLHFMAAKQSKTRQARIEKYMPWILSGKGIHDL